MLTYLIIAVIVTLAIMPLVQFLPSKRQRAIARMREYAAVNGLFVEFRALPQQRPGDADAGADAIYYGLRLPAAAGLEISPQAWLRQGQGWRGEKSRARPPSVLDTLPNEVVAARVDGLSCGVYWHESGGEEQVERIRQALMHWAQELQQGPPGTPRGGPGSGNNS